MSEKINKRLAESLATGASLPDVPGYAQAAAWLKGEGGSLEGLDHELALAAVEAAVKQKNGALLLELESASKVLKKAGRAGLHRLRSAGVVVEEAKRQGTVFTLGRAEEMPPPRAALTPLSPDGEFQFVLSYTDAEGTCVVMGIAGGADGVRNLEHGHMSRSSGRNMWREVTGRESPLVELPFLNGLSLVIPQIQAHAEKKGEAPHDWTHFASHVPADVLSAAEGHDPFGALPEGYDPELLADTEVVSNHPFFAAWPVSRSALSAGMAALPLLFGGAPKEPAEGEEAPAAPSLDDSIKEAAALVFDEDAVRLDWARRARYAAMLADAIKDETLGRVARNLAVAVESGVESSALPLAQQTVLQQIIAGMNYATQNMDFGQASGEDEAGDEANQEATP
ncbi:hypothetical protein L6R49_06955 [Myxococcota bacterium]|nr:hypothetical protein [Myxococcota bacterium]